MGGSLLAVLILAVGGFYLYLRSALPQTDGRIALSGPRAEIRIERDADGVPLIAAQMMKMSLLDLVSSMRRNACSRWSCNGAMAPGGSRKYSGRKRSRRTGRCGCSVSTAPPRPKFRFCHRR